VAEQQHLEILVQAVPHNHTSCQHLRHLMGQHGTAHHGTAETEKHRYVSLSYSTRFRL
jgi:hypothetical protein